MLAILLSVRAYKIECFCSVYANFSVKLNIFFKVPPSKGQYEYFLIQSFFQTIILRQFNKMIICFGCALRFILLIGYSSFTQYCLYLVKVWNNKFLKSKFFHLCSFLCFLVFLFFFFFFFFHF